VVIKWEYLPLEVHWLLAVEAILCIGTSENGEHELQVTMMMTLNISVLVG
jgi:hypothetical protein